MAEKRAMRSAIRETMVANRPVFSPVKASWLSPRSIAVASGLISLLVLGGTAYAAQGSLPGNPLYAVKIHIDEPVQVALAITPEQKAQANASIAERRVAEAQVLAARGTLDAITTKELQANFNLHAIQAVTFAKESESSSASSTPETTSTTPQPGQSESFSDRLTRSLNRQEMVLQAISAHITATESLRAGGIASSTLQSTQSLYVHIHQEKGSGRGEQFFPSSSTASASSSDTSIEVSSTTTLPSLPNSIDQYQGEASPNISSEGGENNSIKNFIQKLLHQ